MCITSLTSCWDSVFLGNDPDKDNPVTNFEIFWNAFDEHYSFFEIKNVNWDSIRTAGFTEINSESSDQALFHFLDKTIQLLRDGHVDLYASQFGISEYNGWFEGKPRNVVPSSLSRYLSVLKNDNPYLYGVTDNGIGYVKIRSFTGSQNSFNRFDEIINSLGKISALILDIRDNGGGSNRNSREVAGFFTDKTVKFGYIRYRNGPRHSDFTEWRPVSFEPSTSDHFQMPLAILTNRRTFSSAEDFLLAMKLLPDVVQVGDTTGGGSGNPILRELPNGWLVYLSHWQQADTDLNIFEGTGILPDVPVWISKDDSMAGRDIILETALEHLSQSR